MEPTFAQGQIRDEAALNMRIIAPAGCGKTEALAFRVAGLVSRGQVRPPQKVLVITFSKRARDNIRDRLRSHLTPAQLQQLVTVINFHGLAGRVIQAHGNVIGLDPELGIPTADWVGDQCRVRRLTFQRKGFVEKTLLEAKLEAHDDARVGDALRLAGDEVAIDIERQRVAEQILTYDDLPRLAELILANDAVADLYRHHFACAIVDEFQDLTLQQLRIVNSIAYARTTYAGDIAQGIYGFAGARPEEVLQHIEKETGLEISFSQSHRSSPAVIVMVNALAPLTDGQQLTCAVPDSWPHGGLAAVVRCGSTADEAAWAVRFSRAVLQRARGQRIGVMTRTKSRRRFVEAALAAADVAHFRWDDPLMDSETAQITFQLLSDVTQHECDVASELSAFLAERASMATIQDADTRSSLTEVIGWICDQLRDGIALDAIRGRVRIGAETALLSAAGVHLLSGHVGKGQQFDWVVVLGAEDGCIPDFRADTDAELAEEARILGVMMSRARHGVLVLHADHVEDSTGRLWSKNPSRFLSRLTSAPGCFDKEGAVNWLTDADWQSIAAR